MNKRFTFLIFFNLIILAQFTNYLSFQILKFDDCLRKVTANNEVLFYFNITKGDEWKCNINIYDYYPANATGFLIHNYEYEFNLELEFIFEDLYHYQGYMDVNVFFNEYIITTHDQAFWRCIDCGHDNSSDYTYENDRINFYPGCGDTFTYEKFYHFYFAINDITDLYKGGKKGAFTVNNTFYSLNSQEIYELTMYDTDNELELINFNTPENFYITDNNTLEVDYSSYYFKVEYERVDGTLKGISIINNDIHNINVDYKFKVTDLIGLNYVLTNEEMENKYAEVKIKITAYNYCPQNTVHQCYSQRVTNTANFIFKIHVLETPTTPQFNSETSSQETEKSSSQEQSDTNSQGTHTSSDNSESNYQGTQNSLDNSNTNSQGTNTSPSDASESNSQGTHSSTSDSSDNNSQGTHTSHSDISDSNSQGTHSSPSDSSDYNSQGTHTSHSDISDSNSQGTYYTTSDSENSSPSENTGTNSQGIHTSPSDTSEYNSQGTHSSSSAQTDNSSSKTITETSNEENTNTIEYDYIHCLNSDNNFYLDDDTYTRICPNYEIEKITDDIIDIIKNIDEDKDYKIIGKDFVTQIIHKDSSNETDKNLTSFSYINFTECENALRNYHKIYSPRKLTFVQFELNNSNDNILVNQIEYQVFDDENNILNLDVCKNSSIKVYYTIKNDTKDIIDLISTFKENEIDILNINDSFYNDVCVPYSDGERDMTLKDRIEHIYNNYQFCEKNCELDEILYEENMISCNCIVKENRNITELNFNLSTSTINIKSQNYKLIKCYNAFTALKDNLNNIGFWIFLFLMILNIFLLILFCLSKNSLKLYLSTIMRKNGYIEEKDEGHAFCHNYIKKLDKLIAKLNEKKQNFLKKKGLAPPKKIKKSKGIIKKGKLLNTTVVNSRNNLVTKKSIKKKKKKNIETEIQLLRLRMNKTKKNMPLNSNKNSINKNSNEILVEENKLLKSTQSNLNENEDNNFKLNLINFNVNDLKKKGYIPNNSEHILNIYNFNEAVLHDKRGICTIYYIYLISKQVIMHAIFYNSPLEPLAIRLSLLKLMLGCDLALNAIFYTDDKVSERYNSTKSIKEFTFSNNLVIILLSTLIGYIIFIFVGFLNNSTNAIRNLFRTEEDKIKKNKKNYTISIARKKEILCEIKNIMKNHKIKIIFFYIIEYSLMIFFWYYVTIFCYIYQKTQLSWLLDCLITIIIRIFVDIFINFIFSLLYKCSINFKSECIFKILVFFYCFNC